MNPITALLQSDASLIVVLPIALGLLTLIVFVHELGHFYFARRFGVNVKEFAIGFPPRLWSRMWGGTPLPAESVGVPSGDRIDGVLRHLAPQLKARELRGALVVLDGAGGSLGDDLRLAAGGRAAGAVIVSDQEDLGQSLAGPAAALPIVRVPLSAAQDLLAQLAAGEVNGEIRFEPPGESPALPGSGAQLRLGGTRFAINAVPLGGYVRMSGESGDFDAPGSFVSRRPWQRVLILVAGPAMNFLLAPLLFLIAALIADVAGAEISAVVPGSPAAMAGLQTGDRLIEIGDTEIHSPTDVSGAVRAFAGREVRLLIQREGSVQTLRATPRVNPPEGEGALGIRIGAVFEPVPLSVAVPRSLERSVQAMALLPLAIAGAVTGAQDIELAGPVRIVDAFGDAARQGPEVVFFLAALLSAQIGLINLFPWPGLDGGRLVFVGFEWLTGRRLPPQREAVFHFVGIMVLLTLAVVITISDVQRLAGF